ncbi:MAG TPA: mucoidy inhibitor MuiA family protein [Fluviicola sp.]|nr:mucoidy inhibitor MuiA family protein [Fluviicola sp.]
MKHWILGALLIPFALSAQKMTEQTIKSDIKKVKLFLTAGEMTHETPIKMSKGRNKLIFSGISAYADPASIQFSASGVYRIVSITTEIDFLAAEQFNPRIKVLKDSLEHLKDRYQANQDLIGAYNAEQAVMNNNRELGGKERNFTLAQLKETAEYYRTRTLEINRQLSKINKEQQLINEQIADTRYQLTELNYNENQRSNQVIILVDCNEQYVADGILKYQVSDCGWAASYDLSATDLNQPISLKYKAQVYNNTGNEWKDVQLTLSTGDPRLSAAHPTMSTWYLDYTSQVSQQQTYYEPKKAQYDYRVQAENEINLANQRAYDNYMLDKDEEVNQRYARNSMEWSAISSGKNPMSNPVQIKQIEVSELTAEFLIPNPFSCPSDSRPYTVEIKEMSIPATFTHVSVPKLDQGAFLIANIVGWQDLDLIPGPTNVYFAGNYVGVSEINTRNVSDTLALSFGRDTKIQVARKLKSEMSTQRVSGNTRKDTYVYDVVLRNNRNVAVKVDVYDQIPVSRNSEITVSVDEIGNGKKDDATGEVKWEVTIPPGETVNLQIGYSVKYPKNAKVQMKTFRTISCPSF